MPELSRRAYLIAVGVGAVGGIQYLSENEPQAVGPIGGAAPAADGDGVSGAGGGGGGGSVPAGVGFGHAATLAGISLDDDVQLEFVTGANRDYGGHVTYEGSLPVHAEGDGYEVAVVDALGDEREPEEFPQWICVVGSNRDYGWHLKRENASGRDQQADDFELAFAATLSGVPAPDILPQGKAVYGDNRDYGLHVES